MAGRTRKKRTPDVTTRQDRVVVTRRSKVAAASQQRPSGKPRPRGRSKGEDGRPGDRKSAG
jgi:hypothetical protein